MNVIRNLLHFIFEAGSVVF